MAISKVIEVSFGRSSVALVRIDTAYFYNNGIIFKPTDIELPTSYQVHWADSPQASSTLETIGTAEGAPIPDDLWDRSRVIYGWIYLHPTEDSGVTAYEVRIYKNVRAGLPDGTEPTPAEQSTIDQLISAMNSAVEQAEGAQEAIEDMSVSATTLAEGSPATVTKSEQDGVVHLAFGIPKGQTGDDGYSPTANVSKSGKTATITITDKNGTTSAQVSDGTDGIDGVSPAVSVTDIAGGHRVVITDKDGAKSFDVEDGATGATPNLTIGTVTTLEPDASATASITGTAEDPVLNLGIPRGQTGEVTEEEFTQLKEDLSDIRISQTINNIISVTQEYEAIASAHIPTLVYGENNSVAATLALTGTNIWGYSFATESGKTYRVSLSIASGSDKECTISARNGSTYGASNYLNRVTSVTTGDYTFDFIAQSGTSSLWILSNRYNYTIELNDVSVVDAYAKTWKYGSLDATLMSEDFPPSGKTVGEAVPPFRMGETNYFTGQNAGSNTIESTDDTSSETYDKGRYNVAVGTNAFLANTDGHHSTAVGFCALNKNTTGYGNTALGEDTLYENTTGEHNVAVGTHALLKANASYNVAVGSECSRSATSQYTVSIGYHANFNAYGGTNNVFIGADAGTTANVNNSIAIGAGVKTSGDNQIIIGNTNNNTIIIGGKTLSFNQDGTVTWS